MLSSNALATVPHSLCRCEQLELVRLANNNITSLPRCLLFMPSLAWIGVAGNPISPTAVSPPHLARTHEDLVLGARLGGGASGDVYRATMHTETVAVKLFKAVLSDGRAEDEIALASLAADVPHALRVLGYLGSPRPGLILEYVKGFVPLAGPPSRASISRDVYKAGTVLSVSGMLAVAVAVSRACAELHARRISHGDLYAHNILVGSTLLSGAPATPHDVRLSDFGASFLHDGDPGWQRVEVRAFGILLDELSSLVRVDDETESATQDRPPHKAARDDQTEVPTTKMVAQLVSPLRTHRAVAAVKQLARVCMGPGYHRPTFLIVKRKLERWAEELGLWLDA
jgi:hypothetical protein